MAKVIAPNAQYNGLSASVTFVIGVGKTDDLNLLAWYAETGLPYIIIFGHTSTFKLGNDAEQLWYRNNRIGFDTGAKHGHRLSLLNLTDKLVYSCSTSKDDLYGDLRVVAIKDM